MIEVVDLENERERLSCLKNSTAKPTIERYLLTHGRLFMAEDCP
jgi:hypothetical protein